MRDSGGYFRRVAGYGMKKDRDTTLIPSASKSQFCTTAIDYLFLASSNRVF